MQYHPMMCMQLKIGGYMIFDGAFHRIDIFARSHSAAIAKAEDVGIDSLCRLPPLKVQHEIRRLESQTGKRL